jgi:tetratricopeptide (TPR) repeat protein
MEDTSPLDHDQLRGIAQSLDAGNTTEAARLLGELEQLDADVRAIDFLTTRLLFQRGRIDQQGAIERLVPLLDQGMPFPEAQSWLVSLRDDADSERTPKPPAQSPPRATSVEKVPPSVSTLPPVPSSSEPPISLSVSTGPPPPRAGVRLPQEAVATLPPPPRRSEEPPFDSAPTVPRLVSPMPPSTPSAPAPASAPRPPVSPGARSSPLPDSPRASARTVDERQFPAFHSVDDDLTPPEQPLSRRRRDTELDRRATSSAPPLDHSLPPPRRDDTLLGAPLSDRPVSPTASTRPPPPDSPPATGRGVPASSSPAPMSCGFDRLKSKSLLPARAGRYSTTPRRASLGANAREPSRPSPAQAPSQPISDQPRSAPASPVPAAREARTTLAPQPLQRRSRRPRSDQTVSLVEQLRWLTASHEFEHALEIVQQAMTAVERDLMRAFVYAKSQRGEEAAALLPEAPMVRPLPPEYRGLLVLTLLELGQQERASEEARRALEAVPDNPLIQLGFICCAVRAARYKDDTADLERAARLLSTIDPSVAPEGALIDALRASVEAHVGSPQVALQLAQRALRVEPDSIDALVALAEAASQVGDHHKARAALETLVQRSPSTAELVRTHLSGRGMSQGPASSASIWLPLENELVGGARESALRGLETQASKYFRRERHDDLVPLASQTSRFFAAAPVFRHFGPYDMSLSSLERLEVALALVYGFGPRASPEKGSDTLPMLAAVYLGETLRQCCQGRWVGDAARPDDARVSLAWEDVWPLRLIENRIRHGDRAPLKAALSKTLELATPSAYRYRITSPLAPETPWGEGKWPVADTLPRIGRALSHSVVALFCSEQCRLHLDRSVQSLHAIDKYLELVATHKPLEKGSRWHLWLSVFVGSYLGEVLCKAFGAEWVISDLPAPEGFAVKLSHRRVTPISFVMEALLKPEPVSLRAWAADLETSGPFAGH